ncbi:hypothetical protein H6G80_27110 [Nostoc sp. FACHB-87]|uniref:hypothetical protein n=1 Tax=Nostocales TaxID=1161 RepID=UPI001682976D|nr:MULTISPECIES: hypothetical protein [Nostocales]MBD2457728.1 hypothetical protein [Nostoc sp. FACHB-87]MBD2478809.1 hypothetical protein [Anabaena sp. FACHB-83]MBD2492582.1 hypothetical protein [Aulosira sp. FACHB-615]
MERLQEDLKSRKISPQEAQEQYQNLIGKEYDKIPAQGFKLPPDIRQALENGLDYKQLSGKVDPNTYNFLEQAYWYGDWNHGKIKK